MCATALAGIMMKVFSFFFIEFRQMQERLQMLFFLLLGSVGWLSLQRLPSSRASERSDFIFRS